ncbi:MAG: hypothetical protein WD398_01665 [Cyclobacteriaceae bacterium]
MVWGNGGDSTVIESTINDSIPVEVQLEVDGEGHPNQYYTHVRTPVCKEGLCYLMVIDLYWDLLGNFLAYKVPEGRPLTKFDHEPFSPQDHKKMTEILSNKDSFLRFYTLDNLVDTTQKKSSDEVDGITGATHKSIKSDVVGGAVYSTYVLWHIFNGHLSDSILRHTESQFDKAMMERFLSSNNHHYQYYALEKINQDNSAEYLPQIIQLIANGKSYVPYFAVEKISPRDWRKPEIQKNILQLLGTLNFEMENEILNRLQDVPISEDGMKVFVEKLDNLEESQLIKALDIINNQEIRLNEDALRIIASLSNHPNPKIVTQSENIVHGNNRLP